MPTNVNRVANEAENVKVNESMPLTAYNNTCLPLLWCFSSFFKIGLFLEVKGLTIEDGVCQFAGNWHRLVAERARHPRCPLPGQPPHPWPLLMPTVNAEKDFSKGHCDTYCPRQLAKKVTLEWHRQQGHCLWRGRGSALMSQKVTSWLPYPRRATLPPAVTQLSASSTNSRQKCFVLLFFCAICLSPSQAWTEAF